MTTPALFIGKKHKIIYDSDDEESFLKPSIDNQENRNPKNSNHFEVKNNSKINPGIIQSNPIPNQLNSSFKNSSSQNAHSQNDSHKTQLNLNEKMNEKVSQIDQPRYSISEIKEIAKKEIKKQDNNQNISRIENTNKSGCPQKIQQDLSKNHNQQTHNIQQKNLEQNSQKQVKDNISSHALKTKERKEEEIIQNPKLMNKGKNDLSHKEVQKKNQIHQGENEINSEKLKYNPLSSNSNHKSSSNFQKLKGVPSNSELKGDKKNCTMTSESRKIKKISSHQKTKIVESDDEFSSFESSENEMTEALQKKHSMKKISEKIKRKEVISERRKETKIKKNLIPNLSVKEGLVEELSCRWWYVLPDWPPKDYDYS